MAQPLPQPLFQASTERHTLLLLLSFAGRAHHVHATDHAFQGKSGQPSTSFHSNEALNYMTRKRAKGIFSEV